MLRCKPLNEYCGGPCSSLLRRVQDSAGGQEREPLRGYRASHEIVQVVGSGANRQEPGDVGLDRIIQLGQQVKFRLARLEGPEDEHEDGQGLTAELADLFDRNRPMNPR